MFRRNVVACFLMLVVVAQAGCCSIASAESLTIFNPSFETPVMADGGFDFLLNPSQQGVYGWQISDGAYIYNPLAADYGGAAGNGTPSGADGSQVGGIFQFGDYSIYQQLAGADGLVGNNDDPVATTGSVYSLTFAVGQRSLGNPLSTYGGYKAELLAILGDNQLLVLGAEVDAETPSPGEFLTRTFDIICPTLLHPEAIGKPLAIRFRKTLQNSTATIDFDNVKLDVTKIDTTAHANFNDAGSVDSADLDVWQENYGKDCLDATHANGNANGDDFVNGLDFLVWQRQYGSTLSASAVIQVPEPVTFSQVFFVALLTIIQRRLQ